MPYPVVKVTMPSSLVGQPNGKLPNSLLVAPGFPGRSSARLHSHTARAWKALAAEVLERFGETLSVTSVVDAYRTYNVQEATFRLRYQTAPLPGRPTKMWNGLTWYQKPNTAMAAVPGTSNHGYGLAVDACLWRSEAPVGITANPTMFSWLLMNADRYGFSWEAQSEPWHIRYVAGDTIPLAVLEYETPPPPPGDDDDMALRKVLCRLADGRMIVTDLYSYANYCTETEGARMRDEEGAEVAPDRGPWPVYNVDQNSYLTRLTDR